MFNRYFQHKLTAVFLKNFHVNIAPCLAKFNLETYSIYKTFSQNKYERSVNSTLPTTQSLLYSIGRI